MSTLNYLRRKRFINALVKDTPLHYKEDDDDVCSSPSSNNTIIMPKYKPDFTEEQDQAFMSELLNKTYHMLPDNIGDGREIGRQGLHHRG